MAPKDRSSSKAEPQWIIVRSVSPMGDFGRAGFRFSKRDTAYPLNEAAQRLTGGTIIPETRRGADGAVEQVLSRIKGESFLAWRVTDDEGDARAHAPQRPEVTEADLKEIVAEQQKAIAELQSLVARMSRGGPTHQEEVETARTSPAPPGARVG